MDSTPKADKVSGAEFYVLGPLRVTVDGADVRISTRRQRALLVLLLLNAGRPVPSDRLTEQLWDGSPPPQATVTLRSYISNLRQALGPAGLGAAITTRPQGYSIDVPPDSVDAVRLGHLAEQGRGLLANGEPERALDAFDRAVKSWFGDPLMDIADHEAAQSSIAQLNETYLGAVEGRFEALLAVGRHADALPGLEAFAAEHPLRESPRAMLMLGLYRAGRAPEALEVHRRFRALLHDELGIDPSQRLELLLQQILDQDPALDPPHSATSREARTADGPPASADDSPALWVRTRTGVGRRIVGRHDELATLDAHLSSLAENGTGALVLLSGEPGIGKTTLVEELETRARHRGIAVHSGRAPSASGAPPYWPWLQVLESIASGLSDDELSRACSGSARPVTQLSTAIAERAGKTAPVTGDNTQALRFLLYEAVVTFLRQACADRPVVITLDDIHWADLPTLELLSYLTPSLVSAPVLLVAAYRDVPAERTDALEATLATVSREDAAYELAVTGLDASDVAALVGDTYGAWPALGGPARDDLVGMLHQRSGGNPFFVRQLTRLLKDSDPSRSSASALPVPPGVRHVIASRLRGLPEPVERLLAAAAVIGRDFDLPTAAAAADLSLDDALDAFDEAARHGLVEGSGGDLTGRRFVHALVQEVVRDQLPTGRAARLHAGVAAALEGLPNVPAARLARHMWEARDIVGTAAIASQIAAGEAAASVFAHEEAEVHVRRALELVGRSTPPDPATELTLVLTLFRLIAVKRGWGHADARDVIDRVLRLAELGGYRDEATHLYWSLFFALLDRNEQTSYVKVATTLRNALADAHDPGAVASQAADSVAVPVAASRATLAAVNLVNIFSALAADDRAAAHQHLVEARQHIDAAPVDQLTAFDENLGVMTTVIEAYWAALMADDHSHRSYSDAAVALADVDGRPFPRAVARALSAVCGTYVGADPSYVRDLAAQAMELCARFGYSWLATLAECAGSWASARIDGTVDDSARRIVERLDEISSAGRLGNQSTLLLMLADVYQVGGHAEAATLALQRARELPGPYQGMFTDVLDRRLRQLSETAAG